MCAGCNLITRASVGKPESNNASDFILGAKSWFIVPGVSNVERRNWDVNCDSFLTLWNAEFWEESLKKNHVLWAHLEHKDTTYFQNGSVHRF